MPPGINLGYWGPPTATLDWCENNYEVSEYIAEFWNTVSNYIYIIPPSIAAFQSWRHGVEMRYILSYLSIIAVGLGSWLFHMTLLYHMQLFDELAMLYTSAIFLYILYENSSHPLTYNYSLLSVLGSTCFIITTVYLFLKNPLFHHTCYGLMAVLMIYKAFHLSRNTDRVSKSVFSVAASCYTLAVILWNIDNLFCAHLKDIRSSLTLPLNPMTEFHAWWHIFTGISTHLLVVFACRVRYQALKKQNSLELYRGMVPFVRVVQPAHTNGVMNDSASLKTPPSYGSNGRTERSPMMLRSDKENGFMGFRSVAKHSLE